MFRLENALAFAGGAVVKLHTPVFLDAGIFDKILASLFYIIWDCRVGNAPRNGQGCSIFHH